MSQTCDTDILHRRPRVPSIDDGASHDYEIVYHSVLLSVCAAVLVGAVLLRPGEAGLSFLGYRWPFYCWLHETTGIRCALCGMSRSFCAMARGDLSASLRFHRLGPLLFAVVGLEIPYRLCRLGRRPRQRQRALIQAHFRVVAAVAVGIFVNWLGYLGGLIL